MPSQGMCDAVSLTSIVSYMFGGLLQHDVRKRERLLKTSFCRLFCLILLDGSLIVIFYVHVAE